MKISIIIPVYNEAATFEKFFLYLVSCACSIEREFIVVDDGSTDGTREILRRFTDRPDYILIEKGSNSGKGSSVREGISSASGDFIIIQDADFEYDPKDIQRLLGPLLDDRADVVYGSRFKGNANQIPRTYHYLINAFLTTLSNLASGIYLTDMETCYKVFRSDLLKSMNLVSNRFGVEVELTANVAMTSARIYELPISYYPRTTLEGKKINWKDGVAALMHILRFNFFASRAFTDLPTKYDRQRTKSQIFRDKLKERI